MIKWFSTVIDQLYIVYYSHRPAEGLHTFMNPQATESHFARRCPLSMSCFREGQGICDSLWQVKGRVTYANYFAPNTSWLLAVKILTSLHAEINDFRCFKSQMLGIYFSGCGAMLSYRLRFHARPIVRLFREVGIVAWSPSAGRNQGKDDHL